MVDVVDVVTKIVDTFNDRFDRFDGRVSALEWMVGCLVPKIPDLSKDELRESLDEFLKRERSHGMRPEAFMRTHAEAVALIDKLVIAAPHQQRSLPSPSGHGSLPSDPGRETYD